MKKLYTRNDYLNGCNHDIYYGQFVTSAIKTAVKRRFTKKELKTAHEKDRFFNTIHLREWDKLAYIVEFESNRKLRECNDYFTLAGGVCILKEAARQLVEDGG